MRNKVILLLLITIGTVGYGFKSADWGFFGHRRINRMAVFTLPQAMFGFYKKHIEFVTDHAVDPDKRRYATKHEAVRHYIDLDHWGTLPFDNVPRKWSEALARYTDLYVVDNRLDTVLLVGYPKLKDRTEKPIFETGKETYPSTTGHSLSQEDYRAFYESQVLPIYYEDDWLIDCDSLNLLFAKTGYSFDCQTAFGIDRFSGTGILPYHLLSYYHRLKDAFYSRNAERILRVSADMGHYIGDAHVPLHTTENYNGQLTNQVGIHAFWESRIPELFADKEYDFFVGPAEYIENPQAYFWDIVLTSHSYVDSVLLIEKDLSRLIAEDKQYCFVERNYQTVRTQCEDYARIYANRMEGMVEKRMRDAIYSIGCVWYSAWVDAGQPDINGLNQFKSSPEFEKQQKEEEALFKAGESKGRKHE